MQQLILPIIPQGTTVINGQISVDNRNDEWFYFLGGIPIYSHQADNKKLFRLHTSQLINAGSCRSIDVITTFGVSKSSVMRSLRQLRDKGADSFFEPRPSRKGVPSLNRKDNPALGSAAGTSSRRIRAKPEGAVDFTLDLRFQ